jgi:hypothetical protein
MDNIGSMEVVIQNNFKSYTIDSQLKAKGKTMLYGEKFEN